MKTTVKYTAERTDKIFCDCCKQEIILGLFSRDSVTIRAETGTDYPGDGGSWSNIFAPDICYVCFRDKILPLLRNLGIDTKMIELNF